MYKLYLLFTALIFLTGCQAAKEGLTGEKRTNADEFLVEKKNPLVLPPEFGELPAPKETKFTKQTNKENKIEDLFSKDIKSLEESTISNSNSDIEKSVLQKIKNK
jgi:hypothetical protein